MRSHILVPEERRYAVERECARGGLGRVLIAHDLRLDRAVAIKELIVPSDKAAARFLREAMVSAKLQHPSIVPVYDAGRWPSGELFYTMKLIAGRSLRDLIDEARTFDARLELLPHIIAMADAMAYAHSLRIIHRDLKPGNVMIGDFGETLVIDWGLAKDLNEPREEKREDMTPTQVGHDLTIHGVVLGTPQYMPPEQANGETVDERADVYAIGAILYHVLVGKPPYPGSSSAEILRQVRTEPPPLLASLPSDIPIDLATIVRKAMNRRLAERYPTAQALADDLRRFLRGQLVSAHVYSRWTLVRRWLQRHRLPVGVGLLCLILLTILVVLGVRRVWHERNIAESERRVALARSNELVLLQARTALERDPTETLAWLKSFPTSTDPDRLRNLALDALSRGVASHVFRKDEGRTSYSAASPDGRWLAVADSGRSLRIWNLQTNRTLAHLSVRGDVAHMSFSPDGTLLGYVEWESSVLHLWSFTTGMKRSLPGQIGVIGRIEFSKDGRSVLLSGGGKRVRLVDLGTGEGPFFKDHESTEQQDVHLSPDGRRLAYAGPAGTIHLVETQSGAERLLRGPEPVYALEFSPDGKLLAMAGTQGALRLWELGTLTSRELRGHTQVINHLQFSGDSHRLISAGADHTVRLWDVASGAGRIIGEHTGEAYWASFSPDDRIVASSGADAALNLWYLETSDRRILRGHTRPILRVSFLGDGKHLMSVSLDRTTRIWRLPPDPAQVLRTDAWTRKVTFSPDRNYLVVTENNKIWRWDTRTGEAVAWRGHKQLVSGVAFSPDGRTLASASHDGTVRLWDVTSGSSRMLTGHKDIVQEVVFSPDGKRLASAGGDGVVWMWDVGMAAGRMLGGHESDVRSLAFSPDGELVASAGSDGAVRLWRASGGEEKRLRGHEQGVLSVAFSHDGRLLVSGGIDGSVRLWGVQNGRGWVLSQQTKRIRAATFSPDDRLVAAAGEDRTILVCDVATSRCRRLSGHTESIAKVAFSPDGKLLASAGSDRVVRLWDVTSGSCLRIHRHDDLVNDVAFSLDGQLLASASVDCTARLWKVEPSPAVPIAPQGFRGWLDETTSAVIMNESELATP